jgi:[acyl-carrier-protein] S-malonyltransferase
MRLAVSIAAHSPLMAPAAAEFAEALQQIDFKTPAVPVFANVSVTPLASPANIQHELAMQLTQSVRWTETIQALAAAGIHTFVEMGPKDVLTGLIKRIDSGAVTFNLNNAANLAAFVQQMSA